MSAAMLFHADATIFALRRDATIRHADVDYDFADDDYALMLATLLRAVITPR